MAGTMEVLNTIGQTIIIDKKMDANSTNFGFNEVTLLLGKENGSSLEGQEFQSKHGGIILPRRLESLDIDGGACVQRQVITIGQKWLPHAFRCRIFDVQFGI